MRTRQIVDNKGRKAVDIMGVCVAEEDQLAEDLERVHGLLVNAPADRAWRRRGYLVLCNAHPDSVQQEQVIDGTHHTLIARKACNRPEQARARGNRVGQRGG